MAGDSLLTNTTFWLAVSFAGFALAAYKPAKGALIGGLDKRRDAIDKELEEARRLREEAQEKLAEAERLQQETLREAEQMIAHAAEAGNALKTQMLADLDRDLKRREAMAMDRIAQAEAGALAEVRLKSANIAHEVALKVLGAQVDDARAQSLIDDAIGQVGQQLN